MFFDVRDSDAQPIRSKGVEARRINGSEGFFSVLRSPFHPEITLDLDKDFGVRLHDYLNHYVNDSVYLYDKRGNRFFIGRDWPGNVMIYYWVGEQNGGKHLLVSDNLNELISLMEAPRLSRHGLELFFSNRKHPHTYTIFEDVAVLPPGFFIEFDISGGDISLKPWFEFQKRIRVKSPKKALSLFRTNLEECIQRLVPRGEPVALMFSGGSDSTLLLESMVDLGYKDLLLCNVAIAGQETERKRAKAIAEQYGFELTIIEVNPEEAVEDWFKNITNTYMGKGTYRIDGWLAALPTVYKNLSMFYNAQPLNIIWGFLMAVHTSHMTLKKMLRIYLLYLILCMAPPSSRKGLESRTGFLSSIEAVKRILNFSDFYNRENIPPDQFAAVGDAIVGYLSTIKNPDELLNLSLILGGFAIRKQWTMYRHETIKNIFYPNARNIFPFFDRGLQEFTVSISHLARFGGIRQWFNMASDTSRKNLQLKAIKSITPTRDIFRGNAEAAPSWQMLFRNRTSYSLFKERMSDPRVSEIIGLIPGNGLYRVPENYDEFVALSTREVEQLSAIAIVLSHIEAQNALIS